MQEWQQVSKKAKQCWQQDCKQDWQDGHQTGSTLPERWLKYRCKNGSKLVSRPCSAGSRVVKRLAGWPSDWQLIARTLAEVQIIGWQHVSSKAMQCWQQGWKKGCRFGKLLPLQTGRKTMQDYS
jgi:hypothetical protein